MRVLLPLVLIAVVIALWLRSEHTKQAAENQRTRDHANAMIAEMRGQAPSPSSTPTQPTEPHWGRSVTYSTETGKFSEHARHVTSKQALGGGGGFATIQPAPTTPPPATPTGTFQSQSPLNLPRR